MRREVVSCRLLSVDVDGQPARRPTWRSMTNSDPCGACTGETTPVEVSFGGHATTSKDGSALGSGAVRGPP